MFKDIFGASVSGASHFNTPTVTHQVYIAVTGAARFAILKFVINNIWFIQACLKENS